MPALSPEKEQSEREALRSLHQVRPLTPEEEGAGVNRLPWGVWGYTYSPATENSPLFSRKLSDTFEVHKAADGEVYLVGFLGAESAAVVETNQEALEIRLYPDPREDAGTLVGLSLSRVVRGRDQSYREGNGLELHLLAARATLQ